MSNSDQIKGFTLESFFQNTLNNIPAVFYCKDFEGKFIAVNDSFRELFDLEDRDIVGNTNYDLFPKEVADEFTRNDQEIFKAKKVVESEEIAYDKEGRKRIYRSYKFPYFNNDGDVFAVGGISIDITSQKDMEMTMYHNSKLASIGTLAAGVAHEVNNPLTIIRGYLDVIESKLEREEEFDKESLLRYLEKVDNASKRIEKIVAELKPFSRKEIDTVATFNPIDSLKSSINLVRQIYRSSGVMFEEDLIETDVEIEGNAGKLQQVFLNLFSNAQDSMQTLHENKVISVRCFTLDSNIIFQVADQGIGISREQLKSVMDPFFTTKDVNQGTGLGLSISKNIIEEHNGTINIESKLGKGTLVTISLPLRR